MDTTQLISVIGREQYDAINASNLPKIETMTLLLIWEAGSRKKLRAMAKGGTLLAVLKKQHRSALEQARETRINNGHLTMTECLKAAELPLLL